MKNRVAPLSPLVSLTPIAVAALLLAAGAAHAQTAAADQAGSPAPGSVATVVVSASADA